MAARDDYKRSDGFVIENGTFAFPRQRLIPADGVTQSAGSIWPNG
jgi:hypothetical protein